MPVLPGAGLNGKRPFPTFSRWQPVVTPTEHWNTHPNAKDPAVPPESTSWGRQDRGGPRLRSRVLETSWGGTRGATDQGFSLLGSKANNSYERAMKMRCGVHDSAKEQGERDGSASCGPPALSIHKGNLVKWGQFQVLKHSLCI